MATTRRLIPDVVDGVKQPVIFTDGTPAAELDIHLLLVPSSARDQDGGVVIASSKITTDASGIPAETDLWICDRALLAAGETTPKYLVKIIHSLWVPIYGGVPAGAGPITWSEFLASAGELSAADLSALTIYRQQTDARLDALETVIDGGAP
jgi:hypothetical protein